MPVSRDLPAPKATRREWIGLAVLALPCMFFSMDLTVLYLAVPQLSADLHPTASQLLWIVDIYGFLLAGSLILMGTLGDRIGRRRLLLIGAAAFGATSLLAAFSTSAEMLILSRALLGIAAATLAPSTLSLLRNMFLDANERTFAIGVWVASFSVGAAIGPLVGGALLVYFWWGSVFLINLPLMLLLLAVGPYLLPEYRDPNAGRLDIASAALSLVAVLAAIYGIKRAAEYGADWITAVSFLTAGAAGALFVRRQTTLVDPLIDVALFRHRAFSVSLGINVAGLFVTLGSFLFIAQYLQLVLGMSPLEAGLWTVPAGIALTIGAMMGPILSRLTRPSRGVALCFLIAAFGFSVMTQIGGPNTFWLLLLGYVILSLGIAPVSTLTTDLVLAATPPERAGAASAISETSFELGGSLGIAVLGSFVTFWYQSTMSQAVLTSVPEQVAKAVQNTLAGAAEHAKLLTPDASAALLATARDAFTHALATTSALCAAISVAVALTALWMLRGVPSSEARTERA